MTCIIALEHNGSIYMGGDSAAVAGWDIQASANPKVFQIRDFLIGYSSSFRMGQLLQYELDIPKHEDGDDDMRYLVSKLIPAVRECLKIGGYTKVDNAQEEGGDFLIGYRSRVYRIANDFQVMRTIDKFNAIGCGSSYALGAMAALDFINPEKAIIRALTIAGTFSNGVCGPYYVLSIERRKRKQEYNISMKEPA